MTIFLVILFAAPARASDLTVYVGGVKPGKIDVEGVMTPLDSSPIYGFRLGLNFLPMFGMEHTIAFSSDYLWPKNISDIRDARGFVYNGNLIVNIPVGQIVPYATAGLGLIRQYGSPNLPVGTDFAVNYGGGLKLPRLVGPIGLRFDLRGYTTTGVFSHGLSMFEVTGGVLFSFGK